MSQNTSCPADKHFTPDQIAVLQSELKELGRSLSTLSGLLSEQSSFDIKVRQEVVPLAYNVASSHFDRIGKILGIETETASERNRRSESLRNANMRIRELEGLIGKGVQPGSLQSALKIGEKTIADWWHDSGFSFVRATTFKPYECAVQLSCSIREPSRYSETPVTDKKNAKDAQDVLRDKGFVLLEEEEGRGDFVLVDCDQTKAALLRLIKERFPSAFVKSFENRTMRYFGGGDTDCFSIKSVELSIRDYKEIFLPSN